MAKFTTAKVTDRHDAGQPALLRSEDGRLWRVVDEGDPRRADFIVEEVCSNDRPVAELETTDREGSIAFADWLDADRLALSKPDCNYRGERAEWAPGDMGRCWVNLTEEARF